MSRGGFHSLYSHEFVRLAAAVPRVAPADPAFNLAASLELAAKADADRAALVAFPELGLSAYAIDDLLFQDAVLDAVERLDRPALSRRPAICSRCWWSARRCAARAGSTTPRWSSTAARSSAWCPRPTCPTIASSTSGGISPRARASATAEIGLAGQTAPFGADLPVPFDRLRAVHLPRRDLRGRLDAGAAVQPAALAGAEVLINLSASNITIGKAETRRLLCAGQSARPPCGLSYIAAGPGESTTDLAWDGQAGVFECGASLAETERFVGDQIVFADVDLGRIRQERMRHNSFGDMRSPGGASAPDASAVSTSSWTRRPNRSRCAARHRAFSVRAVRPGAACGKLLRGLQHPGPGSGAAACRRPARNSW